MVRRSELVDALAAVAVSALSGPLGAIGVSAAGELVKLLQKARGRTSEEKELRKQVREAISAWAEGESLDPDVVDRGLGWAIEYVQAAGCQHELIADADFDPTRAAEAVLTPAKARDKHWGTDPEYSVAERAVHVTYNALCPKLKAEGGVVLAAIQASRHEIRGSIDQLRKELLGVADRHELIDYLEKQIPDWDYSPWTQGREWTQDRRPSQLERTLEIADEQRTMSPAEALEGVWLLTVLGGPGSGKTWLARRLAREAAETALEQLRDPRVDPASVELPLFTTVAEWIKRRGTGFEGLVEATLPHESQEKIRRLVLSPGARVLAVADSLDEGVSVNSARTLLNSLTSSPTRRLVVTSRPEAWHSATAGLRATQDTRIGTLTELRYPKDVHGYVEAWFTENPPMAQHLIRQLEERRELRATATSPLLLTFYCMLTEQEPDQELPRRRRELYRTIIDLLLAGGWATTEKPVDTDACRAILQQWAWDAVNEAVTPAGLGVWPETITTNCTTLNVPAAMERALDNVAPKQEHPRSSLYDHARVERRFLHRTLWEYLVSEHIATFSAAKAAKALLPHIWFDPEWRVTLPMAIAAHRRRSRLVDLLWTRHTDSPTPAQKVVNDRLEELVLEVAAQTDPEDWNKANRARIRALRDNFAPHQPELIASSAHWGSPNHVEAILAALLHAAPWEVNNLIETLLKLNPTDTERAQARHTITTALALETTPQWVKYLIDTLLKLNPTNTERAQVRHTITTALQLPKTTPWGVNYLINTLLKLNPTDTERAQARHTITTKIPKTTPREVDCLIDALLKLNPTDTERAQARHTITTKIPKTTPREVHNLIDALLKLNPTDTERAQARHTITTKIPKTTPWGAYCLIDALLKLNPTNTERAQALHTITTALQLPKTTPQEVHNLINALLKPNPTNTERAQARHTITTALQLPKTTPWEVHNLINTLLKLNPTNTERAKASHTITTKIPKTTPGEVHNLINALLKLNPTNTEQAQARHTITTKIPKTTPWGTYCLIDALLKLNPTNTERAKASHTITTKIPKTTPWEVNYLIDALLKLNPTNTERAQARHTITTALALETTPQWVKYLIDTLLKLNPTNTERAQARHTITTALQLPKTTPWEVHNLINTLLKLNPTNTERAKASHTITTKIPKTTPWEVHNLIDALLKLNPTNTEQAQARHTITTKIPNTTPREVHNLIDALLKLNPTNTERAKASHTITTKIPNTTPWEVHYLIDALLKLNPTDTERAQALHTITTKIPNTTPWEVHNLIDALLKLNPTDTERAQALHTITTKIPKTTPREVDCLIDALLKLNPTDTERAQARHTITTALALKTTPREVDYLINALLKLNPTNTERAQARHTITTALALKTTPREINNLINTLLKLNPTNTEHTKAQQAIIETLPHASSRMIYELVGLLRQFAPVDDWLAALGIEST
ncbi:NACHT domain [Arachnia propionica]|nr:NACHT domain [Arachnia propionica]